MALAFTKAKGYSGSNRPENFKFIDGVNKFRLIGNIIPRYCYWVPHAKSGKDIPIENLGFNRDTETFDGLQKDWVKDFFPNLKSKRSYIIYVIDDRDNKIKVLDLKVRLHEQINNVIEDLGDPTNLDTGWWLHVKRSKTGPLPINIEYSLLTLKCKPEALSDELKELVASTPTIEEVYPLPTSEDIKKALIRITATDESSTTENEDADDIDM